MKNDYPDGNEEYDAQWPSHRSDPLTPPPHGTLEHAKDDTQLSGLSPRELRLRAFSVRVGVIRGVNSPADPRKPFIYRPGPSRKPDSALSRHPSPGIPRAPRGEPRLPAGRCASEQFGLLAPVVYLAGPSRGTAGGLLPHPFTHHL
jgi:hypothetical protein